LSVIQQVLKHPFANKKTWNGSSSSINVSNSFSNIILQITWLQALLAQRCLIFIAASSCCDTCAVPKAWLLAL